MRLVLLDQKRASELAHGLLEHLEVMDEHEGSVKEVAKAFHITETQARQTLSWAQTFSKRKQGPFVLVRTPKPGVIRTKTLKEAERLLEVKGLSPRLDFFAWGRRQKLKVVLRAKEALKRKRLASAAAA